MGITITDVKIVGYCKKCRERYNEDAPKDKHGKEYPDKDIACVGCQLE